MKILTKFSRLCGDEVSILDGDVYLWMSDGVYTVEMHPHLRENHRDQTGVTLTLEDTFTGKVVDIGEMYDETYDDYEIIHRWVFGGLSCDCQRGKIFYSDYKKKFKCGHKRFILRKMAIGGEKIRTAIIYRNYR